MATTARSSRLRFYDAEDDAFDGVWQHLMPAARAYWLIQQLAYETGEEMPTVIFQPTGRDHAADRGHIWLLADDTRPLTVCHEFAHVIQARAQGHGAHDTHFAALVALMVAIAERYVP